MPLHATQPFIIPEERPLSAPTKNTFTSDASPVIPEKMGSENNIKMPAITEAHLPDTLMIEGMPALDSCDDVTQPLKMLHLGNDDKTAPAVHAVPRQGAARTEPISVHAPVTAKGGSDAALPPPAPPLPPTLYTNAPAVRLRALTSMSTTDAIRSNKNAVAAAHGANGKPLQPSRPRPVPRPRQQHLTSARSSSPVWHPGPAGPPHRCTLNNASGESAADVPPSHTHVASPIQRHGSGPRSAMLSDIRSFRREWLRDSSQSRQEHTSRAQAPRPSLGQALTLALRQRFQQCATEDDDTEDRSWFQSP